MAKYSGPNFSLLLVDGYNITPAITEGVTMGYENITQETHPFGQANEENSPIGITKGEISAMNGLFDATVDPLHGGNTDATGAFRVINAAIEDNAPGRYCLGFEAPITAKIEVLDQKDGLAKMNVTYRHSGEVDDCQIIQDLKSFTASWDTKTGGANAADTPVDYCAYDGNRAVGITSNSVANPTIVTCAKAHGLTSGDKVLISGNTGSTPAINGIQTVTVISSTTFSVPVNVTVGGSGGQFVRATTRLGGSAYMHCTAYSGFTNVVLKIMHSPDDVTYAALVTFTTITAANAHQRTTVAPGNIDRYLSSNGTVTGSGSITVFSAFSRN